MAFFGSGFIIVNQTWTQLKNILGQKAMSLQFDDQTSNPTQPQYQLFAIDAPIVYVAAIWSGTVPPEIVAGGYSQAQNNADQSDFLNNWFNLVNKPVDAYLTPVSASKTSAGMVNFYGAYVSTTNVNFQAIEASTFVEQTSAASRSFSSTSTSDAPGNAGAASIQLCYYDNAMNGPFFETVTLNGTSSVNTVGGNIRFVEYIKSIVTGSNGANVGNINMFASTGGAGGLIAQIIAGDGKTFYGHHYVRPNKTFYLQNMFLHTSASNGSSGGNVAVKFINTFTLSTFEDQIGTQFRSTPAQATHFQFENTIQIVGPARVRFYVKPDSSVPSTFYANFGWDEY